MSTPKSTARRRSLRVVRNGASDEAPAQSPSHHNAEMNLQLLHVYATLDLVQTVARSKDAFADLESLYANTLESAIHGAMCEIERVRQYIDNLPCNAEDILLSAIAEMERRVEEVGEDTPRGQRLRPILDQMIEAHSHLDELAAQERAEARP